MQFDLVLFADGYHSNGRRILFPEKELKYRGYILWRGLLEETQMDNKVSLDNKILRLHYKEKPGHLVMYYIPGLAGDKDIGNRIFNWAAYVPVPMEELRDLMVGADGRERFGTLPPGQIKQEDENRLKGFLSSQIPGYYAEVVNKTKNSYIQVIYTLDLDHYSKDNMCLIGDAGMVIQPFTGSGVFKGYNNVKDLIDCLGSNSNIEEALLVWSRRQLKTGKRLLALGEQMEKAFIWEPPDFSEIDESSVSDWWARSVTFPDNFNFQNHKCDKK